MKFFYKVFAGIFCIAALMLVITGALILRYVTSNTVAEYIKRYQNVSKQVGDTLVQIDKTTDRILTNALFVLREREKVSGLPSNNELLRLKNELGVDTLYITNSQGKYLRSDYYISVKSDPEMMTALQGRQPLTKPLFSYCKDYKNLISGGSTIEKTPIIPSGIGQSVWPYKFLMIPNHDRTRILEGDMAMNSIGDILTKAMEPDPGILSIGLFAPEGDVLGYVHSRSAGAKTIKRLNVRNLSFGEPQKLSSSLAFYSQVATTMGECCECRAKGLTTPDGKYYYVLRTEVSRKALNEQLADIRNWFLRMGLLALFLSVLVAYFVSKRIVRRLAWMGDKIEKIADTEDLDQRLAVSGRDEVAVLASRFDGMLNRLKASQSRLADAEKEKALVGLARQVAHDIRSPLAALDSVINEVAQLPEGQRIIVRGALGRIRDIANDLLGKHRELTNDRDPGTVEPLACALLSSLIDPIITEKRLQYRGRMGVVIDFPMQLTSYGLFAKVQPVEFKRAVSNIINNAVEAIEGEHGSVLVTLAGQDGELFVKVRDDGKGIAPEVVAKLGQKSESHGKVGGSGLGLHHARTSAEAWGGRLDITSEVGKGTNVTLVIPRTPTPEWFVAELPLSPGQTIVILDDDTSIHQVWQGRIESLGDQTIECLHFSVPQQLRNWVADDKAKAHETLYLLDHEFLGFQETGLDLARELEIGSQTVLVTSRHEEPGILEDCRHLGVRMIPKGLAGLVPIRLGTLPIEPCDVVFIDNDYLARLNWKHAAAKAGKHLRIYSSAVDFFQEAARFDRQTEIYVDHELGDNTDGNQIATRMSELGFTQIYLATGHEAPPKPWPKYLKGVVGKEPPWTGKVLA